MEMVAVVMKGIQLKCAYRSCLQSERGLCASGDVVGDLEELNLGLFCGCSADQLDISFSQACVKCAKADQEMLIEMVVL